MSSPTLAFFPRGLAFKLASGRPTNGLGLGLGALERTDKGLESGDLLRRGLEGTPLSESDNCFLKVDRFELTLLKKLRPGLVGADLLASCKEFFTISIWLFRLGSFTKSTL